MDHVRQVALQHDHHSFFAITWMGGVWAAWLHECILVSPLLQKSGLTTLDHSPSLKLL